MFWRMSFKAKDSRLSLGKVSGQQALAVRTTEITIHTWDLAQAIDADTAPLVMP